MEDHVGDAAATGPHRRRQRAADQLGAQMAGDGPAVVIGPENLEGRVYGVLDSVGGRQLAQAFYRLEDDGVVMAIGRAAREATVIDFELAGTRSARGRIENFNVTTPFGGDLAHLVGLLTAGELDAQVGWRGPWDKTMEAADALLARRVAGKAVLDL
ncbi:zinc-binding dehydrogenase [Nonomuraea aurantiaca]|uniref:zinc-binding dehydrogenase n=1 Tax=Nonomuraea aurantiaca TaxID=2878562 RepID=UPI001CD9AC0C|nr:zinc-binding dehydrogenase [Nonomuraea aurantiaca]MCA2220759.1 zinc-binding dehydrogenase [Nonomuraea aurantiaca]